VSKQFENIAKELLKPTYTSSPEDELLKKKNENLDKMENQEKNQKGTKSTIKTQSKQWLRTIKKVIETNERNIEQGIKTEFVYEDLLNIKGETESTMRRFNATILKLSESLEKEGQERNEFIERIPKTIEIRPSEDYLNLNKALEKNSKFMKTIFYGMIAALFLSVLITAGNIFLPSNGMWKALNQKVKSAKRFWMKLKKMVNLFIKMKITFNYNIILS
jgi:hypothetical protein